MLPFNTCFTVYIILLDTSMLVQCKYQITVQTLEFYKSNLKFEIPWNNVSKSLDIYIYMYYIFNYVSSEWYRDCLGHDLIVGGFTTICAISAIATKVGEVYSLQLYVIKFVSDLRQVSGFLRVLWFPSPTKLTATI